MNKQEVIRAIDGYKIITIVRGLTHEQYLPTAEAMYRGGIRLMEITFDQSGKTKPEETADAIRTLAEKFTGRMFIGAGTVMTPEQVDLAAAAGALYIISPDTNPEVIRRTVERGLVSIPGALTPTEAATAHRAGADYVKLFPAGDLGVAYIKSVKAPLSHIKFLAVGGIDDKNLSGFLAVVGGVGVGSSIVKKSLIAAGEFDKITELARRYTKQIPENV